MTGERDKERWKDRGSVTDHRFADFITVSMKNWDNYDRLPAIFCHSKAISRFAQAIGLFSLLTISMAKLGHNSVGIANLAYRTKGTHNSHIGN